MSNRVTKPNQSQGRRKVTKPTPLTCQDLARASLASSASNPSIASSIENQPASDKKKKSKTKKVELSKMAQFCPTHESHPNLMFFLFLLHNRSSASIVFANEKGFTFSFVCGESFTFDLLSYVRGLWGFYIWGRLLGFCSFLCFLSSFSCLHLFPITSNLLYQLFGLLKSSK